MEQNDNCHIKLYTGKIFYVTNPRVNDVDIRDIAHALSNQGRFSGHTSVFYSVAEHSVRASYYVAPELALCALLHDATEAYLVDLPRPIKRETELGKYYSKIESILWDAIAERFGLPDFMPREVKVVDSRMLATEMRDLMGGVYGSWVDGGTPFDEKVVPLALPFQAEQLFLDRYYELTDHKMHGAEIILNYGRCIQ